MTFRNTLALFMVNGALAIAFSFVGQKFWPVDKLFSHTTFYFLWGTLVLLAARLRTAYGGQTPSADAESDEVTTVAALPWDRRTWSTYIGVMVALTAVSFLAVGTDFRVLSDESNLLSTSRSLFLNRTVVNLLQGDPYYGYWGVIESGLPTRPALFPFALSLLHTLRGFSAAHGFAVNFLVAVALGLVMLRFGEELVDRAYGLAAAVILAAFPLYQLVITSSGYDAMNLLGMMLVFWLLYGFLSRPSATRLEILVLTTILAGQCRYESVLLLLPVAVAAWHHRRLLLATTYSWSFPLLPLLLLPIAWQRLAMGLTSLQQDGRTDVFAIHHVLPNLRGALTFFYDFRETQFPRSEITMVLAALGVVLIVREAVLRRGRGPAVMTGLLMALGLLLVSAVQLTFYMGDISAAYQMRMGLIYLGAIGLAAAVPIWALIRRRLLPRSTLPLLLIALFAHEVPVAARNEVGKSLLLYREFKNVNAYLAERSMPFVVISDWPVLYAAMGYGAMSFHHVETHADKVRRSLALHLYDAYAVLTVAEGGPPKQVPPPKEFRLETVAEWQNDASATVRLVKLLPAEAAVAHPASSGAATPVKIEESTVPQPKTSANLPVTPLPTKAAAKEKL